jgi:hypothetical protein
MPSSLTCAGTHAHLLTLHYFLGNRLMHQAITLKLQGGKNRKTLDVTFFSCKNPTLSVSVKHVNVKYLASQPSEAAARLNVI